jgi:hypothetical protein
MLQKVPESAAVVRIGRSRSPVEVPPDDLLHGFSLSHARTSTTMNVYAHSVPGGDREAAETLATIIAAPGPGERRKPKAEPNKFTAR